MEETYGNPDKTIGDDIILKLAMIILDALGIDLIRMADMKHLNNMYMNQNSQILTCSTYPHTQTSNIMIWSGQHRNFFWIRNKTNIWVDPAGEYDRDNPYKQKPGIELIKPSDLKSLPWIWKILQANGYRSRAVQLPFTLPPFSFNATEETKDWFPYWQEGLYNNLRDKERITLNSLRDMKNNKLDFYSTSFPQPDKLLHGIPEGHFNEKFVLNELQYLDTVAKKIDNYCNKHNIVYCIFGDHGPPRPEGDNFGYHIDQKIAVVRHQKHSVIISNYKSKLPDYTDELYPWMLDFFDIDLEKILIEKQILKTIK